MVYRDHNGEEYTRADAAYDEYLDKKYEIKEKILENLMFRFEEAKVNYVNSDGDFDVYHEDAMFYYSEVDHSIHLDPLRCDFLKNEEVLFKELKEGNFLDRAVKQLINGKKINVDDFYISKFEKELLDVKIKKISNNQMLEDPTDLIPEGFEDLEDDLFEDFYKENPFIVSEEERKKLYNVVNDFIKEYKIGLLLRFEIDGKKYECPVQNYPLKDLEKIINNEFTIPKNSIIYEVSHYTGLVYSIGKNGEKETSAERMGILNNFKLEEDFKLIISSKNLEINKVNSVNYNALSKYQILNKDLNDFELKNDLSEDIDKDLGQKIKIKLSNQP